MHVSHHRSASAFISSPIDQSFLSSTPLTRSTHEARRPSLTHTMSMLKDSLKAKIHENVHHRRAFSHGQHGHRSDDGRYEPRGIVISDPQLTGSSEGVSSSRLAPLGSGAIVVSTPQEALALSAQQGPYRATPASASVPSRLRQHHKRQPEPVEEEAHVVALPSSPPLPPLPAPASPVQQPRHRQRDLRLSAESSSSQGSSSRGLAPVLPDPSRRSGESRSRHGSPLTQPYQSLSQQSQTYPQSQLRTTPEDAPKVSEVQQRISIETQPQIQLQRKSGSSSLRSGSDATTDSASGSGSNVSESDSFAAVPQLPIDLASALPQPAFEPVLMSNLPANIHNTKPRKLIIILETSSTIFKSTLQTLTTRPSYLATYLTELISSTDTSADATKTPTPKEELTEGDGASMYSQRSEFQDSDAEDESYAGFNSLFQDHLTATGIIKPRRPKRRADATTAIHVFLDRPSAPYEHIMAYLRAPVLSTGMLPYAARLFPAARHSFATARLEALLDLRDEASYLGLDDLQQLCDDELAGQVPLVGSSAEAAAHQQSTAADAERSSVHSTHTLCEPVPNVKDKESSSPPVRTVDIPVVLPAHVPHYVPTKATKTYSSDSTSSAASRRERRVGQIDLAPTRNALVNASQLRQQSRERDRAKQLGNYF